MEEGARSVVTGVYLPVDDWSAVITFILIAILFVCALQLVEYVEAKSKKKKRKWPPEQK